MKEDSGHLTNHPLQIYRANDAPYYRVGNKVLIAIAVWSLANFVAAKYYYVWRNKYDNPLRLCALNSSPN